MSFNINKLKEDIIKSKSFTSPIWEDLIEMGELNDYLDNNEDIKTFRNNISIGFTAVKKFF